MSDLIFKINVETDSGREYSWYSSSFARSDEVGVTTSILNTRINNLYSASYTNDASEPSTVLSSTGLNFGSNSNNWLSASHNGASDGSIIFNHTDSQDTADRLRRYRFFGTKVCNVLGFPEGQWQYPVNFQLADNENDINFFSGDISANRLTVSNEVSLSPISKITSNLRFDIHDADLFIQYTSGSAANRINRVLFGYNTDNERFELDAGIQNTADTGNDRYNSFLRFGTGSFYDSTVSNTLTTDEITPPQHMEIMPKTVGLEGGPYEWLDNPCYSFSKNQATGAGGNLAHCSFAIGVKQSPSGGPMSGSVFQIGNANNTWHRKSSMRCGDRILIKDLAISCQFLVKIWAIPRSYASFVIFVINFWIIPYIINLIRCSDFISPFRDGRFINPRYFFGSVHD